MTVCIITIVVLVFPNKVQSQIQQWKIYNTSNSGLPHNYVCHPVIDAKGNFWISTNGYAICTAGGLAKFDGDTTWTIYNKSNSRMPSNNVWKIVFDDEGNKWVGTWDGKLVKFNAADTICNVYNTSNSKLPNNNVFDIAIDAKGNKWIGTEGGLACFDGDKTWEVYRTSNSRLPHNSVFCLEFDSQGNLWIGIAVTICTVSAGGLAKFDCDTTWTVYNPTNSPLPWHQIRFLTFDKQGTLWMGLWSIHTTTGGLASFDGEKTWEIYIAANSEMPCANGILGIAIDSLGNKWMGTGGGGLAVFNENGIIPSAGDINIINTSKRYFLHTSKDSLNITTKLINKNHHNFSANIIYYNKNCNIV